MFFPPRLPGWFPTQIKINVTASQRRAVTLWILLWLRHRWVQCSLTRFLKHWCAVAFSVPSTDLTISVSAYHQRQGTGTEKRRGKKENEDRQIAKRIKMWLCGQGKTCNEEWELFEIIICQVQMQLMYWLLCGDFFCMSSPLLLQCIWPSFSIMSDSKMKCHLTFSFIQFNACVCFSVSLLEYFYWRCLIEPACVACVSKMLCSHQKMRFML